MTGNLLWATFGGLVGFAVGVLFRDALALLRADRREHQRAENHMSPTPEARRERQRLRLFVMVAFTVMLVITSTLGVLLIAERLRNKAFADCTAKWQQEFAIAYEARVKAQIPVSNATDRIVLAVANGQDEELRDALDDYLLMRKQQNAERESNPLPELPVARCGVSE